MHQPTKDGARGDGTDDGPLARARAVAEVLAPHAAAVDQGKASPRAGYQAIRDAGLLALLVPTAAGGSGCSFLEHMRVLETLAAGDAAIALGYNMHNVAIGALCESAGTALPPAAQRFRDWVFTEVVKQGRMFASAVSEPGSGAKLRGIKASYRRTDDGYLLDGTKSFVSLADIADYYVVAARPADADHTDEVSHFVVPRDAGGISFGPRWDGAALAGTETATMTLAGVRVGRDQLFLGVEGMSLFKLVREPHWMTAGYVGAYLGIATAIRDSVVAALVGDGGRRDSPVARAELGRIWVELEATRALIQAAARLVDEQRGSAAANAAVHAAKYRVGEVTPRLAQAAIALCGPAALQQTSPVQRLLREASFCAIMPAKSADCLEYVAQAALGANVFDARTLSW